MSGDLEALGALEHEVMQLVWAHGRFTAEQAREQLRRLEDKGNITHTVAGRRFLFVAAEARHRKK